MNQPKMVPLQDEEVQRGNRRDDEFVYLGDKMFSIDIPFIKKKLEFNFCQLSQFIVGKKGDLLFFKQ